MPPPDRNLSLIDRTTKLQVVRESELGITCYVDNDAVGFIGTLKQRYTDFQVHEIMIGGQVVTVCDTAAPDALDEDQEQDPIHTAPIKLNGALAIIHPVNADGPAFALHPEAQKFLDNFFEIDGRSDLLIMYNSIITRSDKQHHGFVTSRAIGAESTVDYVKAQLSVIFNDKLDTKYDPGSRRIKVTARDPLKPLNPPAPQNPQTTQNSQSQSQNRRNPNNQIRGKAGWDEKGGEHLHMTLYKENKDTMEVIGFIARQLRVKPRDFGFAGTKDRRAATSQRVSVRRQTAERMRYLSASLKNAYVGNFSYEKQRLELGELEGNLFVLTLRDCDFDLPHDMDAETKLKQANEFLSHRIENFKKNGFLNYFGLQRFGSFGVGTDVIGLKILQGDFKGAVDGILHYDPKVVAYNEEYRVRDGINKDDVDRAMAIWNFRETGSAKHARDIMPKKFSAELAIMMHLSQPNTRQDWLGALQKINRNTKTMYVHAYQSLVWNTVASQRYSQYGAKVIKGDLVLVDTQGEKAAERDEVDENGEVVIHPAAHDLAVSHDDIYQRARPLTAEEAESGQYSIFNVVLPTPGYDVNYPDNDIGDYYKTFMSSARGGGIDPGNMRRNQKDFSLSGSYRPLLGNVSNDMTFETRIYYGFNTQLVDTDLEKLRKSRSQVGETQGATTATPTTPATSAAKSTPATWTTFTKSVSSAPSTASTSPVASRNMTPASSHNNSRDPSPQAHRDAQDPTPQARHDDQDPTSRAHRKAQAAARTPAATRDMQKATVKLANNANMSAWMAAGTAVREQDKVLIAASASETARLQAQGVAAPAFKDTWHEVTDSSKTTGITAVETYGEVKDALNEQTTSKSETALETKIATQSAPSVTPTISQASIHPFTSIAPAPTTPEPSNKRGAEEISTSRATSPHSPRRSDGTPEPARIAVILTFSLGTSQYATMALRELMKSTGVRSFQPEFWVGRRS